ncbi:MAG: hypothetical protein KC593_13940 [Myxococcales bacterium]|nr:hypothetical protein [Myxococcales bacterium]
MMISEQQVAAVVAAVSAQLTDPAFGQVSIGGFVETQPDAARFLTLAVGRKVGAEEAMQAVFHATVMESCFQDAFGGASVVTFAGLDAVGEHPGDALTEEQPALASYLATNVPVPAVRDALARVAVCWSRARAVEGGAT